MTDPCEHLADELAAVADAIRSLAGRGLPDLSFVQLTIQPAYDQTNDTIISTVDAVGRALLGEPGGTKQLSSGNYHHGAYGKRGPLWVRVYQQVDPPEKRALEAELARLRAEVEAARQAKEEDL